MALWYVHRVIASRKSGLLCLLCLVALCCACPACVVLPRRSEGVIIWSLKLVTQAAQARFMTRHTLNAFAIHSSMHTIQAWNCTALHGMGCVLCVVEMWLCAG